MGPGAALIHVGGSCSPLRETFPQNLKGFFQAVHCWLVQLLNVNATVCVLTHLQARVGGFQQVSDLLPVNFQERTATNEGHLVILLATIKLLEDVFEHPKNESPPLIILHRMDRIDSTKHGVCLARARLTVDANAPIVAVKAAFDNAPTHQLEGFFL
jgi:hypothetical protein